MAATVTHLPVTQPAPSPGSTAIARGILSAGCGPEAIPWLVAGFRHAAELEQEITAAMAVLAGASSLEEYLSSTGCAAVPAASHCACGHPSSSHDRFGFCGTCHTQCR